MTTLATTRLCPLCGAVITSGASLCRDDTEALMNEVRNASDLLRDLDITLAREDRVIAPSAGGKSPEVPMPFHIGASHAATELRASIRAMARGTVSADQVRGFRQARSRALEVVDIPDPRVFVGVCVCETPVYARRTEVEVACRSCGEVMAAERLDSWRELRELAAPVATLRQWLLVLGVVRSRAQMYRDVARLAPVDDGNVYRLADVLDRVAESKSRRRGA